MHELCYDWRGPYTVFIAPYSLSRGYLLKLLKLRSEEKETLGYLQQASLLRTHCVLLQSEVLRQWYIVVQGFLKSCTGGPCTAAFAPILIKLTYLWFSNDPEDINMFPSTYFYAQFGILHKKKLDGNAKMRINLKKSRGVKTFEQNGDVYIFLVLPKYHIFDLNII